MVGDITSANSTLYLTVDELFPAGVKIQQFSADTAYSSDSVAVAQARMGVDGMLAAGQVPTIKQVTIMLEASSPSNSVLTHLHNSMDKNHRIYNCKLVATQPALGVTMTWSDGVLISGTPCSSAQKVLAPTQWVFNFRAYDKSGGN